MKIKQTVIIGIVLMAIGSAAGSARAGGLQFSISVGVPHVHIQPRVVVAPPVLHVPAPRVVFHPPRVLHVPLHVPVPRLVVVGPPVCPPVPPVHVRHWNSHSHRDHYIGHSRPGGHHIRSHGSHSRGHRGR